MRLNIMKNSHQEAQNKVTSTFKRLLASQGMLQGKHLKYHIQYAKNINL